MKHFVVFITFTCFFSCRDAVPTDESLTRIEGLQIEIDADFEASESLNQFFAPYRERIDTVLDSALAYAPNTITKADGDYNTTAGNLVADIVMAEAGPIFKSRTGEDIDFAMLNHGGIRSVISKGKVTARTAFEVMPFENAIVIARLSGKSVQELIEYLRDSGRAHPISGLQVVLNKNNAIRDVFIKGQAFDMNRSYNVATSDYLLRGGDGMVFFGDAERITEIDYKIRDAMIDYFKKTDTVAPMVDNRFYRMQ